MYQIYTWSLRYTKPDLGGDCQQERYAGCDPPMQIHLDTHLCLSNATVKFCQISKEPLVLNPSSARYNCLIHHRMTQEDTKSIEASSFPLPDTEHQKTEKTASLFLFFVCPQTFSLRVSVVKSRVITVHGDTLNVCTQLYFI